VDLVHDAEEWVGGAPPVVTVVSNADASTERKGQPVLDGCVVSCSLTAVDENDPKDYFAGVTVVEVLQPPAAALPDPTFENVPPQHVEARLEQLREINDHFRECVRRVLPLAPLTVLSPYEFVVDQNGRLFHVYVDWEGA